MDSESILNLENLSVFYGTSEVVKNVSMSLEEGSFMFLVGRIGSGKTTLFKGILQLLRTSGNIKFKGKEISEKVTREIVNMGIGYVPEDREIFGELTVKENLMVPKAGSEETFSNIYDLFPNLEERKNIKAKLLSGGEQQMLSIARTLLKDPDLLLLDEPYEGLAGKIKKKLNQAIKGMKEQKEITVLIAESTFEGRLVKDRTVLFFDRGKIIAEGSKEKIKEYAIQKGLEI